MKGEFGHKQFLSGYVHFKLQKGLRFPENEDSQLKSKI